MNSNQEQMFSLIANWRESGQSQEKFCAEQNIGIAKFGYWRKKHRAQHSGSPAFSEVMTSKTSFSAEISFPDGVVVRLQKTNAQELRLLMRR